MDLRVTRTPFSQVSLDLGILLCFRGVTVPLRHMNFHVSVPPGSVRYDEGETEAECLSSSMDMSNPVFLLYEAVRGGRNSQGQLLSEPFLQLPSRREYPDYYQQIKQPISLQQIR